MARRTPEDLCELREIEELKYRYLRAVDLRLWDELAETFTEDATASYGGGNIECDGRDAILEFLSESMPTQLVCSHKVHHPEIALDGDTATGTWGLEDHVIDQRFDIVVSGAAFYEDRYAKVDGEWKIAHTGYKRVWEEITPRAKPEDGGPTITAHWWDTDGRSNLNV